jgi:hypothetical protein
VTTDRIFRADRRGQQTAPAGEADAGVVGAARAAVEQNPAIGAFVFECTNLPPYADAVRRATSRPVWDATSLIYWLRSGVRSGRGAAS